ncbi:MAG: hypothetical protein A2939_03835 [Parcubacteria group bacterium RIFCSPLOWO2_01_FULL_48_18]|nr:MAG: hypothetical protein A3J67_02785 [Parcubacteria group bacterium RIFCSPHIGHO2_02_FULL_48_10b]OHB22407.1 MAG: hypothetical protein A2939_03835 [Parcubacteria group bacterium RIFCSPLOWO2_01_FULL_48_18]
MNAPLVVIAVIIGIVILVYVVNNPPPIQMQGVVEVGKNQTGPTGANETPAPVTGVVEQSTPPSRPSAQTKTPPPSRPASPQKSPSASSPCEKPYINAFIGCYYTGTDLDEFKFSRIDAQINFDWGFNAPDERLFSDIFSVKWSGFFAFASDTYEFQATSDDGMRAYVDGKLILDKWFKQTPTLYRVQKHLSAGAHTVTVEYYEDGGGAVAKLSWMKANEAAKIAPPSLASDAVPPSGFQLKDLSPFYGKAWLSISGGWWYGSGFPSVEVGSRAASGESKLNITGWRIKSNRDEITVPQAVEIVYPGGVGAAQDIMLASNQFARIFLTGGSAGSQLGYNIRLNMCTGYLNETYGFDPALPVSCPRPSWSDDDHLPGYCQDYIAQISTCTTPQDMPLYIQNEEPCRNFINERFGYPVCFEQNRLRPNFLSDEWRVYVNRSSILDPLHDRVLLLDRNSLLVDMYTY